MSDHIPPEPKRITWAQIVWIVILSLIVSVPLWLYLHKLHDRSVVTTEARETP